MELQEYVSSYTSQSTPTSTMLTGSQKMNASGTQLTCGLDGVKLDSQKSWLRGLNCSLIEKSEHSNGQPTITSDDISDYDAPDFAHSCKPSFTRSTIKDSQCSTDKSSISSIRSQKLLEPADDDAQSIKNSVGIRETPAIVASSDERDKCTNGNKKTIPLGSTNTIALLKPKEPLSIANQAAPIKHQIGSFICNDKECRNDIRTSKTPSDAANLAVYDSFDEYHSALIDDEQKGSETSTGWSCIPDVMKPTCLRDVSRASGVIPLVRAVVIRSYPSNYYCGNQQFPRFISATEYEKTLSMMKNEMKLLICEREKRIKQRMASLLDTRTSLARQSVMEQIKGGINWSNTPVYDIFSYIQYESVEKSTNILALIGDKKRNQVQLIKNNTQEALLKIATQEYEKTLADLQNRMDAFTHVKKVRLVDYTDYVDSQSDSRQAMLIISNPELMEENILKEQEIYDFHDLNIVDTTNPKLVKLIFAGKINIKPLKNVRPNRLPGFVPNALFARRMFNLRRNCPLAIPSSALNEVDIIGVVKSVTNKKLLLHNGVTGSDITVKFKDVVQDTWLSGLFVPGQTVRCANLMYLDRFFIKNVMVTDVTKFDRIDFARSNDSLACDGVGSSRKRRNGSVSCQSDASTLDQEELQPVIQKGKNSNIMTLHDAEPILYVLQKLFAKHTC